MENHIYDDNFYKKRNRDTEYAAVKIWDSICKRLNDSPKSVVDVGCGVGTWLRVGKEKYGVNTVVGIDGAYVPDKYLQIDKEDYIADDLETYSVVPVLRKNNNNRFDIAVSLEVAEHISASQAEVFIGKLCDLSDIICFSAAIPGQGGWACQ